LPIVRGALRGRVPGNAFGKEKRRSFFQVGVKKKTRNTTPRRKRSTKRETDDRKKRKTFELNCAEGTRLFEREMKQLNLSGRKKIVTIPIDSEERRELS